MKYLFLCAFIPFLSAPSFLAAEAPKQSDDIDLIENAIIVDGLSLTAETPPREAEKENGSIVFDDGFVTEDSPAVKKVISDHRKKKAKSSEDADDILRDLQKDDSRWHYSRYLVRKGDTLWSIARKFDSPHRLLVRINGMTRKEMLRPGKKILVPNRNGVEYKVRPGDTVTGLAKRFRTDPAKIMLCGRNVKKLRAGSSVFISDAAPFAAPAKVIHKTQHDEMIAKRETAKEPELPKPAPEADEPKEMKKEAQVPSRRIAFTWPLQGRITSGFGTRVDPFSRGRRFHNGIDVSAEIGTPVRAAEAGTVIFSGWKDGYGKLIVVKHEQGYVSVYGHNSELNKKEGETVEKGDVVSLSGMTGAVTGAHLHFEIQKYGTPLNPMRLLK